MRGPLGSAPAFPLNNQAAQYFNQRGVNVKGQIYEDLLEAELFDVLETISAWLSEDERRLLDETTAFGAALTREPNARAEPYLDGFAILYDYSFDTLLISATELWYALLNPPKIVSPDEFPLALNTAVISVFFQRADYATPIPSDGFFYREHTNSWVWLMSVFLLSHEVGHISRGHLNDAPMRDVAIGNYPDEKPVKALKWEFQHEFEADEYAIELMFKGEKIGGLIKPDASREVFWNSAYITLGWLFTILEVIETLNRRLEFAIYDTHPPAAERWNGISALIRNRVQIDESTIELERMMNGNAVRSAEFGELPAIHPEIDDPENYTAVPYSETLAQLIRNSRASQPVWQPPPQAVIMAWMNASTLEEGRNILKQHPELLHPNMDEIHYRIAAQQPYEISRLHILQKRLPLLRRCREIGIDAAFEELSKGGYVP